eukprot:scaffold234014_cov50-Prasinocladus_malaysianus.AAC.1
MRSGRRPLRSSGKTLKANDRETRLHARVQRAARTRPLSHALAADKGGGSGHLVCSNFEEQQETSQAGTFESARSKTTLERREAQLQNETVQDRSRVQQDTSPLASAHQAPESVQEYSISIQVDAQAAVDDQAIGASRELVQTQIASRQSLSQQVPSGQQEEHSVSSQAIVPRNNPPSRARARSRRNERSRPHFAMVVKNGRGKHGILHAGYSQDGARQLTGYCVVCPKPRRTSFFCMCGDHPQHDAKDLPNGGQRRKQVTWICMSHDNDYGQLICVNHHLGLDISNI